MKVKVLIETEVDVLPTEEIDCVVYNTITQKAWNGLCGTTHRHLVFKSVYVRSIHPIKELTNG